MEKHLKELDLLKQKGVITDEEYQSRRATIIASADLQRKGNAASGIFKWGAIGCLSIVGGFVLLVVAIGVLIAVAIGGSSSSLKDGHGDFAEGANATAQTAGGVKVKVTIQRITNPAISTNQFEQPKSGDHYITVAVEIENVGERETAAGLATLRTTDGTEYQSETVIGVGASDLNFLQPLSANGKTNGVLAFEIANNSAVQWLKFDPNPFADGDIYFDAKSSSTGAASTVQITGTTATGATAGGSGESDYFTQLASIFAGGQTGTGDANTKLNNDLGSAQTLDENRAAINTFLDTMVGVFSTAITRMQALNPPDDARDAHNKFLQDVLNAKTKSSDLKNQLANASTLADFHTIVNAFNTEVEMLVSDANVACVALQDLDNQHGANVSLSCDQ